MYICMNSSPVNSISDSKLWCERDPCERGPCECDPCERDPCERDPCECDPCERDPFEATGHVVEEDMGALPP